VNADDEPRPVPEEPAHHKEHITLPDARYLIFYTFPNAQCHPKPPMSS
jgi:hypothetical protein